MIDMARVASEPSRKAGAQVARIGGVQREWLSAASPESPRLSVERRLGAVRGMLIGVALGVGLWALIIRAVVYAVSRLG